jgi:hypothetical protein
MCKERNTPIKFIVSIGAGVLLLGVVGLMLIIYPPDHK